MANTLDTQQMQHTLQGARIRRLTPTECARLQGFDDNWCSMLSDNGQYRCYGNAVSVPVVKAIAERLKQ